MAKSILKISLSASRDIPFDKLVLSQSNVRHVKAGVSIDELAADIARRTLLQSLTVRPVLNAEGAETGMYEIPAGGRRFRALELLVNQKRLAKNVPIPCIVRTEGIAEEDSLAENVQRAPLHPLDQFRAFLALREKGQSEEEIAAVFFVAVAVVKQRLRLASVSPALLDVYAEDGMTLDQLMAFSVSPDHERQEQVWEAIQRSYNKEPYQIRRLLTEGAVRAADKRALYAGEDYAQAGGAVIRDLFQPDDGGWLQDVGLLDRLVAEKLERDSKVISAEGWKWIEVAPEFPYGQTYGMRVIASQRAPLSEEEIAKVEALRAQAEEIEECYADADELPEEIAQRLEEIEAELAATHERPALYDQADIARAGAFVSIDGSGKLRVQRGYVRPEDEAPDAEPALPEAETGRFAPTDQNSETYAASVMPLAANAGSNGTVVGNTGDASEPADEDEGIRPLSDKLLTELTAYRTLALREAVGNEPAIAYLAALHALCLKLFYRYGSDSCLEIEPKSVMFGAQAPGLADTPLAARVDARHRNWAEHLPEEPGELWDVLGSFDTDSRDALFAHCVSLTINAVVEPYNRRPKAIGHADKIAAAISLDLATAEWTPTVDNYLGRVPKARILEAVREAKGEKAADRIGHLKKGEMATEAESLLAGTGWLPEPLRTPGTYQPTTASAETIDEAAPKVEETAASADEKAIGDDALEDHTHHSADVADAIAAE
ncbi:MAG: DNA-binding protein [Rhodospirillales bacterium 20-58-10]|nr:MAG: DNA-binding protein [Rhodospirillales bacterium 20-58-10]